MSLGSFLFTIELNYFACYNFAFFLFYSWAQIEVETQRTYPDWVQAFGAGILEGSLTWNNIYNQWKK